MVELMSSGLPLATLDLAAKKTPVPGYVTALFLVAWVIGAIFVAYMLLRRRGR